MTEADSPQRRFPQQSLPSSTRLANGKTVALSKVAVAEVGLGQHLGDHERGYAEQLVSALHLQAREHMSEATTTE